MTEMCQAVRAVGLSMNKRKKNLETLENAVTLDPCHDHDPPFNSNTTKMIRYGHMVDVSNLTNFGVNTLIGVQSLGDMLFWTSPLKREWPITTCLALPCRQ